jgi:hypothetical protein
MVSQKNPLNTDVAEDGQISKSQHKSIISNKGFMSKTTNTFMLGIIGKG